MTLKEYVNLVLIVGATLTFLMSVLLWFYPKSFFANKVLAILTFFWGYTLLSFSLQEQGLIYHPFTHIWGVGTTFILLFFPLIYMYVKTYLYRDARIVRRYLIHGIPAFLYILFLSPFYFQSAAKKRIILEAGKPEWLSNLIQTADVVIIIQGVVYTVLVMRTLHHFQYFRKRKLSAKQVKAVKWLQQFAMINIVLWAIGSSGAFLEIMKVNVGIDLFMIYFPGLTLLTLWVGFFTLMKPELFSMIGGANAVAVERSSVQMQNNVPPEKSEDLISLITYIEQHKPFLKNELNLQDLVDGSGLSKHRISEVLNNELNKTFYDIINEYRTTEAIRLIREGIHKQHTLTHLAEMAGFNSKATFNRIFKKITGKTPTEYIEDNGK